MRCRKVRSFLSAYSKGELGDRRKLTISEHLSTCSSCRKEESVYRSMNTASAEIPQLKVANDFNTKLLTRVAQERFAQTRTKAYLPKPAPRAAWGMAIPAVVTAFLLVFVGIATFAPGGDDGGSQMMASKGQDLDDSYLTVQPVDNPNMAASMPKDWSLAGQLEKAERINRISNTVNPTYSFDMLDYSSGASQAAARSNVLVPYVSNYFKVRPVVRVYVVPEASSGKEVLEVY